ncbi:Uncharacterized protein PBTT_02274 [Plasmodiophora brassicae]|uniref:Uncharacterized protein n=1 Tax=Plasmodiophora brassicae TaxID=37360 RepID=A0A0G4J6D1_PLABS|nr:hypothetical protein PBRA_002813 [Plasmodiophora brassicae]SPQ94953.1 unnamed protein product [Plasmodiophora brassicae]
MNDASPDLAALLRQGNVDRVIQAVDNDLSWSGLRRQLAGRWDAIASFLDMDRGAMSQSLHVDLLRLVIARVRAETDLAADLILEKTLTQVPDAVADEGCRDPRPSSARVDRQPVDLPGSARQQYYYKLVGLVGGRFFSLYDGVTEYKMGEMLQPSSGRGVFVYADQRIAGHNRPHLPRSSKLKGAPRVLLRLKAIGEPRRSASNPDKVAFDAVIPVQVVRRIAPRRHLSEW